MVAGGRRDEREVFTTPGPLKLDLRVPAGKLELHTADGDETVVELEALRDNESSIAAVEAARLELRERTAGGREVYLEVPEGRARLRVGGSGSASCTPEVLVRISCPEEAGVDIETGSADIEARGRFGSAKVAGASGDVEFEEILGEASIATASGDIELGRIDGRARINLRVR